MFSARTSEFERDVPFGPFVAVLDDHLADVGRTVAAAVGDERLSELAIVFPALARLVPRCGIIQAERYRSYRACRALLEVLGRNRPLVLALDDVHWADAASAELLAHLLCAPPRAVLIALAFRPRQLSVPLAFGGAGGPGA